MVDCGTWDDPWFAELEPAAKLLFLYLLTNRRSTPAGCFEITLRAVCFETGLTTERVNALIPAFGDRIRWWPEHQVIWLKNFYRRQMGDSANNPKFLQGARKSLAKFPLEVQQAAWTEYPEMKPDGDAPSGARDTLKEGHTRGMDTPSMALPKQVVVVPVSESEKESVSVPEEIEATPHSADAPSPRSEGDVYALVDAFAEGKGLKKSDVTGALRSKSFRSMQSAPAWVSPADVFDCTRYLMTDPFWQKPGKLQAQQVVETLPDWRKDRPEAWQPTNTSRAPSPINRNGAIDGMAKVRELEAAEARRAS